MESISDKVLSEVAYTLLSKTATSYSKNYLEKMRSSLGTEKNQKSKASIATIIQNILYAAEESASLCQDVGVPAFNVYLNPGISIKGDIRRALTEATIRATEDVPIRKNVVEPFKFTNLGNNTGWGAPFIYFHYDSYPGPMRMRAELKGFGGEAKSTTDWIVTSTENMENAVLAYVLNNVLLSKGEGCVPGFLGVGLGGYASEAMFNAKNAVFKELSRKQPEATCNDPDISLREFEKRIFRCVNSLGLGPMGGGGQTTTLGVYLERRGTHTGVAPVSVSQQCWASRASEALIGNGQVTYITPHVEKEEVPALRAELQQELVRSESKGIVHELTTPLSAEDLLKLRVGDVVYLNGIICTARDRAHRRMVEHVKQGKRQEIPEEILSSGAIYHSGPVVEQRSNCWCITASGPTTSSRFTDDAAFLIEQGVFNLAVGKGTMGGGVVNALKGRGVYLNAVGGCAVVYQKMIKDTSVKWLELGHPEAVWVFDMAHFGPLVVSIDSKGNSATGDVMEDVYENARRIYREEGLDPRKRYVQYPQTFAGLSLEEVIQKGRATEIH
jgi:fumarate hydratase, class I